MQRVRVRVLCKSDQEAPSAGAAHVTECAAAGTAGLQMSICLRPYSRASMDHAPGPSASKPNAMPAWAMCSSQRLSVSASPMLRTAAQLLAAGVQHPNMSRPPVRSCAKPTPWALQDAGLNACCRNSHINSPPAQNLSSSKPAPGTELGKVEKSRCIIALTVVQPRGELYTRKSDRGTLL